MHRIFWIVIIFLFPFTLLAYSSPGQPKGFVNDFAQILDSSFEDELNAKLKQFKEDTTNEIAVVTINSTGDESIEEYAVKLFEEWGIGGKETDNGILLLFATDDRKMRIEVGYGLEGNITDILSANIIKNILTPSFRENDFSGGISRATNEIIGVIKGDLTAPVAGAPDSFRHFLSQNIEIVLIFSLYLFLWIISILARTKSWWVGGVAGGIIAIIVGIFSSLILFLVAMIILVPGGLLIDYVVSKNYKKSVSGGRRPPWWTGGSFGGGMGGGFGGFGGGRSGGGGASGGW